MKNDSCLFGCGEYSKMKKIKKYVYRYDDLMGKGTYSEVYAGIDEN
jgi:hypothetical protein